MKFHHYGIVVKKIESHIEKYWSHLTEGALIGPVIEDPLQKVKVCFIDGTNGRIELVEPTSENSPVAKVLKMGAATFHHICIEVPNLDEAMKDCRAKGMVIISDPKPAVAFAGRRIAFVVTRDLLVWELLEEFAS